MLGDAQAQRLSYEQALARIDKTAVSEAIGDWHLGDAQELMNRGASAARCSGFPVVCGECIVTG